MASEGKPLCLRDFNEKFGVKCHECCKFIAGKVLQVLFPTILPYPKIP